MNQTVENPFAPSGDFAAQFSRRVRPPGAVTNRGIQPPAINSPTTTGRPNWVENNASFDFFNSGRVPQDTYYGGTGLPGSQQGFAPGAQVIKGTGVAGNFARAMATNTPSTAPGINPNGSKKLQVMQAIQQENRRYISPMDSAKIEWGRMPANAGIAPYQNPEINALLEGAGYTFNKEAQQWVV